MIAFDIIGGVIGGLAGLIGIGGLVFAAGRFTESVKANTKATDSLATMLDGHLTWSAQVVREHDERFHEQDTRITRLEDERR